MTVLAKSALSRGGAGTLPVGGPRAARRLPLRDVGIFNRHVAGAIVESKPRFRRLPTFVAVGARKRKGCWREKSARHPLEINFNEFGPIMAREPGCRARRPRVEPDTRPQHQPAEHAMATAIAKNGAQMSDKKPRLASVVAMLWRN